jgi:hypothetical protein
LSNNATGSARTSSSTAVITAPFGQGNGFIGGCVAAIPSSVEGCCLRLNHPNTTTSSEG